MNRSLLPVFLFCLVFTRLAAQAPFATMDSVNVNNMNASMLVHGDMWFNPATSKSQCFFPAYTMHNIAFAASLWMSGYDTGGTLHIAAQTYRQIGCDYWPGPLDANDTVTYAASSGWNKIWKVNNTDIQSFLGLATHTITNTPQSILVWPGKGNVNAQGFGGASLTVANDMAPFVDLNANGIYEPLLGEYPDIKGDEALWVVYSDNGPTHNNTKGLPLGVEVHTLAYGYNRGTLVDNVVYYEHTIINRSPNTYTNFRIGQFADPDIGYNYDDYIGFDSVHRMGIAYNSRPYDSVYGYNVPMVGVTMIVMPGDTGTNYIPAGSFTFFNNDNSVIGNPSSDTQYNYYLRGEDLSGTLWYQILSSHPQCNNHSPDQYYCYCGDPSNLGQCSECALSTYAGDRRFIITTNDFTLIPGAVKKIVMALIATYPGANACGDSAVSFDSIKIVADTAWADYFNPPVPNEIKNISINNSISIYPNPAHDILYVQTTCSIFSDEYIAIYNLLGQKINLPVTKNNTEDVIDVSSLPPALYYIVYRKDNVQKTAKFVKE